LTGLAMVKNYGELLAADYEGARANAMREPAAPPWARQNLPAYRFGESVAGVVFHCLLRSVGRPQAQRIFHLLSGQPSDSLDTVEREHAIGVGRIGGIEKLEEFDEFAAPVAILDQGMDPAGDQINAGQQADRAVALIFVLACKSRMHAGLGGQVRSNRFNGLNAGFLIVRDDRAVVWLLLRCGRRLFQDFHSMQQCAVVIDSSPQPTGNSRTDAEGLCPSPFPALLLPGRSSAKPSLRAHNQDAPCRQRSALPSLPSL
jgi:hypothetical protein